jgi:hypothetical protein
MPLSIGLVFEYISRLQIHDTCGCIENKDWLVTYFDRIIPFHEKNYVSHYQVSVTKGRHYATARAMRVQPL